MGTRKDEMLRAVDGLKSSASEIHTTIRDLGDDAVLIDISQREMLDRMNRIRRDLDNHFIAVWREYKEFNG